MLSVSIVVDNYNQAPFLEDALRSALDQTHPAREVILVDDGSTDASREIARAYAGRGDVQTLLKDNAGQGSAFNAGFRACRGDVVIFLDADDTLDPAAATTVAATFETCPSAVKVQYELEVVGRDGQPLGMKLPAAPVDPAGFVEAILRRGSYATPPTSGNAFSRGFLARVLPLPEPPWRRCADAYLCLQAAFGGEIRHIARPLGRYRRHGDNDTLRATLRDNLAIELAKDELVARLARERRTRSGFEHHPRFCKHRIEAAKAGLTDAPLTALLGEGWRSCAACPALDPALRLLYATWFLALACCPGRLAARALELGDSLQRWVERNAPGGVR